MKLHNPRCKRVDLWQVTRITERRSEFGIGSVYSKNVSSQLCSSFPKCGEDKRMELVAVLILIALIAVVGGIVEESAETH